MSDLRALVYHSHNNADRDAIVASLIGTGLFGALDIDTANLNGPALTVQDLQAYDCVYVWTGFSPIDPIGRGDLLADYVDAGGGVVLAVAALARTDWPFEIRGRIASPTYSPLVANAIPLTNTTRSLDYANAMTEHPILDGVAETGTNAISYDSFVGYSRVTVDPGLGPDTAATLIGRDNLGDPLIALSNAEDVAAFNIAVRPGFNPSAGVFRALANTCEVVGVIRVDVGGGSNNGAIVVNLKSNGVVTVLIYGSDLFDVIEVDTSTLTFADAGVKIVGKKNNELCTMNDFDNDGYDDLSCKFNAVDLGALDGTSTEAQVKGRLTDGTKFIGTTDVIVVQD